MLGTVELAPACQPEIKQTMKITALVLAASTPYLASQGALAQTTRTSPSASSTIRSIPSSSSTSPNSPCNPTNPTSPCYSANAPHAPCYSAISPNEPCSTTTTPSSPPLPQAPTQAPSASRLSAGSALTTDQAKSRIEKAGYAGVFGLRKAHNGSWRATAMKDGQTLTVTLHADGTVTPE